MTLDESTPVSTSELLDMAGEAEELIGRPVDFVLRPSLEKSPNRLLKEGEVVGQTASCGCGHTICRTIAFGWLPAAIAKETDFEIEAYGKTYRAAQAPRTLYDPENLRLLS